MALPLSIYNRTPRRMPHSLGFKRYAMKFGGDGYVEVPHSTILTPNDFTIEVMVRWTGGSYGLLRKGTVGSAYYTNYAIYYSDTICRVYFGINGTSYWARDFGTPKPNRWTWLAITFKDATEVRTYQDGVQTGVWDIDFSYYKDNSHITVGAFDWGGLGYFMVGDVAFLRFYNRVLSYAELLHNLLNYHNPLRNGLVLWLHDKIVGDTWQDESGLGNNGTIYGAVKKNLAMWEIRAEVGL